MKSVAMVFSLFGVVVFAIFGFWVGGGSAETLPQSIPQTYWHWETETIFTAKAINQLQWNKDNTILSGIFLEESEENTPYHFFTKLSTQ